MPELDQLNRIFELQKVLMDKYQVPYPGPGGELNIDTLHDWTQKLGRCIIHEGCELEDWTPWKHWSVRPGNKYNVELGSPEHREEMRREIIDLLHFVLEAAIVHGLSAKDLFDAYVAKSEVNRKRQERPGY
jgi:hypothetical protein